MLIDATGLYYKNLNEKIRAVTEAEVELINVCGQRYIGCGIGGKEIIINGTPGNGLSAYMNGCNIVVNGNAQDAVGDTMNAGKLIIHGHCGDTTGYGMRGGEIYIRDGAGCRVGIHMKEYGEQKPAIVIGGSVGDFFAEYQAGGTLLVLGLDEKEERVGRFCGTGMHGGRIYIRGNKIPQGLPVQVKVEEILDIDKELISRLVNNYCAYFGGNAEEIMAEGFMKLCANTKNPYRQLYTNN